jgi:hypothetical protein
LLENVPKEQITEMKQAFGTRAELKKKEDEVKKVLEELKKQKKLEF